MRKIHIIIESILPLQQQLTAPLHGLTNDNWNSLQSDGRFAGRMIITCRHMHSQYNSAASNLEYYI